MVIILLTLSLSSDNLYIILVGCRIHRRQKTDWGRLDGVLVGEIFMSPYPCCGRDFLVMPLSCPNKSNKLIGSPS